MAPKTVQPIAIELDIKGGEQLGKLSSAFRDLAKTVGQTDAGLEEARRSIIEYGRIANQSEALIQGQIKAFEGLRKQAEIGGRVFTQLGSDIDALKGVLRGASAATEAQRQALVNIGSTANATTTQIQGAINSLIRLRGETRPNSEAFNSLGESIERLTSRLNEVTRETEELALAQQTLNQSVSASAGGAQRQIQSIDAVTRSLRQQRDELGALGNDSELVQRRQREGLASLIERGVQPSGRRSFEDVYAESLLSFGEVPIESMVPVKDLRLIEEEVKRVLQDLQEQIETSLTQGIKRSFQETARAGRESARAMAAAFADPEMLGILERLDQRIGELPNTTAGFNQRLGELQRRLVNTAHDSEAYVLVSLEIARVQREATAATQGLGAALVNDLASGVAVRSQRNLREAIGQLRTEMADLNTTTTEGSALYAQKAAQANRLQKELDQIANSYRTVGEAARQANAAMGSGINPFGAAGSRNPAYSRAQEKQEMEEIAKLQQELNGLEGEYVDSLRSALQTMQEYEQKRHDDFMVQVAAEDAAQEQAFKKQEAREEKLYQAMVRREDRVLQRGVAAKGMLGLTGDLSPFYERIVGIAQSRQRGVQSRMGKTPQQSLADIVNVFNSDLRRTGSGFLDSEQKIREAAIDFSGGSRKVRERFEEIPIGKTPTAMYPQAEESPAQYRQRIEGAQRSLIDRIRSFGKKLDESGDGFLKAEKDLRKAAIDFAGGSEEVKSAFKRFSLGKTPMQLFPAGGETPEAYVERIRGGFTQFDIPDFSSFRKGTTRELQLVRDSLSELRLDLDPLAAGFETMEKKAVSSIQRIDRELERRQSRGARRRMSPMQMTQAAGAAISGGIFGGPEGFLGGVGGALVGGVGGAFAGAAIGAQVGGLRRQLGDFADYAAGIQKLQIALRGAAGSQDEFNRAMAAASAATTQLNVPQDVAVRNMTRLTAAVKGAGGQVSDAEIVFRNVSSAIKATGGSAQDVDSAITAMVQVFSKGKVSAEELSGQLGERLPGAVTMFAKANKMTLPELQKALKDGTVGLNELMNFIIELGNKYDGTAKKIAGSSEEAGARLQVAYNQMRIDVGKALQPVGAEFQDAFAEFIKEITPALVVSLPKIAEAFAQIGRVVLDVSRAIAGAFAGMFAELQSQSETAAANINSLFKGIGEFFSKIAKFMSQQWQFRIGEIIVNASGGNTQVKKIIESLGEFWKQTVDFMGRYWGKFVEYAVNAFAGALTGPVQVILQKAGINLGQVAASFVSGFGGGPSSPKTQKDEYSLPENVSDFPGPTPDSSSGGGGGKGMAGKIRNAENGVLALRERLSRLIRDASFELDGLGVSAEDAIDNKFRQAMARANDAQDDLLKKIKEFEATTGKTYDNLRKDAIRYGDILITIAEKQKNVGLEELANKRFAALLKGYGFSGDVDVSGKMLGSMTPQEFPTGVDSILQPNQLKQNIEELRTSLQELVDPVNQITNAATAIGDAFAQSFTSAISGASTAKEALASFFQSVGSYFLDMAKQIIAKMIQIAILNSVARVLPGLGSNAGSGFNLTGFGNLQSDAGSGIPGFMAGAGGILGRANGGPVNANQPYIVGERGPELFIPFQQGSITSNEELEAQMRETGSMQVPFSTSERMRETREVMLPFTRSSEQASMIAAERETAQAISNPGPIDVRYESQVINGVEYITAEQHRKGMAQAAERGRALTLQALQNSVKTRSRVGI